MGQPNTAPGPAGSTPAAAAADDAAAKGGAGYHYSPEAAKQVIDEIDATLDWLEIHMRPHADKLTQITPPGDEVASNRYASTSNSAGQSYNNYLNSVIAELGQQKERAVKARDVYLQQEQQTAEALKRKS